MTNQQSPSASSAGTDQEQCGSGAFTLAGNVPTVGTGVWSIVGAANGAVITTPGTATSGVTGLNAGSSVVLRWTISNGLCPDELDEVTLTNTETPTVDAGINQTVCEGDLVNLSGTIGGSATEATWSGGLGDFSFTGDLNATYTPHLTEAGTTIILTLTTDDPLGSCTPVDDQVSIIIPLTAVVNAGIDLEVCGVMPIALSGMITSGASTGTWTGGVGIFSPDRNTLNAIYTPDISEIGGVSVVLTLTSTDQDPSCPAVIDQVSIVVSDPPTVNAGTDQTVCIDQTVLFNGAIGGGATSAQWTGGAGTFNFNGRLDATYFPDPSESGITVMFTLTTDDPSGPCSEVSDVVAITFDPVAEVEAGADFAICEDETAQLEGEISGATSTASWSGGLGSFDDVNALNAIYTPDPSEYGTAVILTLTTNDPTGPCPIVSDDVTLTVNLLPVVGFAGLDAEYALNSPNAQLFGFPAGGTFSGPGVVNNSIFSPLQAGVGTHTIRYDFVDPATGCANFTSQDVKVNELPEIGIPNLAPNYCVNDEPFELVGSPQADGVTTFGEFTGSGIVNDSIFNPGIADVGVHTITYTFTDENNTTVSTEVVVFVNPLPEFDFQEIAVCIGEEVQLDSTIVFINNGINPQDSIVAWEWDFGDNSGLSDVPNPVHLYETPGLYTVNLKATSVIGCTTESNVYSITIGDFPTANFQWTGIIAGSSTNFEDISSIVGTNIVEFLWDFDDPTSGANNTSTEQDPSHLFSNVGTYSVTLTVTTDVGCSSSVSQEVSVFPNIGTGDFPYTENFDGDSPGGWITQGTNTSWEWGVPNGTVIDQAASGTKAWVTNLDGFHAQGERSYIVGPYFKLGQLDNPMISFKIWSFTETGISGAILESSVDGGQSWQRVGNSSGSGSINWYNSSSVIGSPGDNNPGDLAWSGQQQDWMTVRHNLDFLKAADSVTFRIFFGADNNPPETSNAEGFAIDNIFVGNRSRGLLLEHFTNMSCDSCIEPNSIIKDIQDERGGEVVVINYHMANPGADVLNEENQEDPSARSILYSVAEPPRSVLDGANFFSYSSGPAIQNSALFDINLLKDPRFEISIDTDFPSAADDVLQMSIEILALDSDADPIADDVVVQVAIVENQITDVTGSNGETVFYNVLKKMLPDAAGTSYSINWVPGVERTLNFEWPVENIHNSNEIGIVVFVQNRESKEVYNTRYHQAPPKNNRTVTGLPEDLLKGDISIYPIPTNDFIHLRFNQLNKSLSWELIDTKGVKLMSGDIDRNVSEQAIDVSKLADGAYFLTLNDGHSEPLTRKILIRH